MPTYDLIVFGATGFTGKRVAMEIDRVTHETDSDIKWAVAGRSEKRLREFLRLKQLDGADVIRADVSEYDTLLRMAEKARVILNCVGPYRHYGENVVSACVESGCSYVDVCGEPQFLEEMAHKYGERAREKGVFIVGACGFDSVPSDLGVQFLRESMSDAKLTACDAYLDIRTGAKGAGVNFATYESAVYGIGDHDNLRKLRKSSNNQPLPVVGRKVPPKTPIYWQQELGKYAAPFPGADVSVVRRTQRYLHENHDIVPVQFQMYFLINSLWGVLMAALFGSMFKWLAYRNWGRSLLLRFPSFFSLGQVSKRGPTERQMRETSFSVTLYGYGYTNIEDETKDFEYYDRRVTVKVSGPEPGYVATPIIMVQSALTLLKDHDKLPSSGGGVFTSGAVFQRTRLIERLIERGISFKIIFPRPANSPCHATCL